MRVLTGGVLPEQEDVLSHRCLSHPKCDSIFSSITWVIEQGQYLFSGQLSDIREGLQLPQRIDLVFNMVLSSLKEFLGKKKSKRRLVRGKHSNSVGKSAVEIQMGCEQSRSKHMEEYNELSLDNSFSLPFVKAQGNSSSM